ncbi:MAG: MarR family transcriptional regulator [Spirochaetales bacterium]|nr:MarR family transcriptional regulator [Spirochaetales bacterium]
MRDIDPSPKGIIDLVSRVNEASRDYLQKALIERNLEGIVPAHGQVFFPLFSRGGPLNLKEIVRLSGRAKSTVTGMVQTLEKYGYVKRLDSPEDRRSVVLALTEKGAEVETVFHEISKDLLELVYRDVSREEQEILIKLLYRVEDNLKSEWKEE